MLPEIMQQTWMSAPQETPSESSPSPIAIVAGKEYVALELLKLIRNLPNEHALSGPQKETKSSLLALYKRCLEAVGK
jgi:hypothetical protein